MREELIILERIDCWKNVKRPKHKRILYSKFVLLRKWNQTNEVQKYNARLIVCRNEEDAYDGKCFSPISEFSTIKLILGLAKHRKQHVRDVTFRIALQGGLLERSIYIEGLKVARLADTGD